MDLSCYKITANSKFLLDPVLRINHPSFSQWKLISTQHFERSLLICATTIMDLSQMVISSNMWNEAYPSWFYTQSNPVFSILPNSYRKSFVRILSMMKQSCQMIMLHCQLRYTAIFHTFTPFLPGKDNLLGPKPDGTYTFHYKKGRL